MTIKNISEEELTVARNPSELAKWVEAKMDEVGSTDAGESELG